MKCVMLTSTAGLCVLILLVLLLRPLAVLVVILGVVLGHDVVLLVVLLIIDVATCKEGKGIELEPVA